MNLTEITKNYPLPVKISILAGLIDSDGCIGWTWSKDGAFIPSIYVTQKKNMKALQFLKLNFGGNTSKNGNWGVKNMKNIELNYQSWLYSNKESWVSCRLITSRRFDAHLLDVTMGYCRTKFHKTKEGTAILIRFRLFLHGGTSTTLSMTQEELCERRTISPEVYAEKERQTRDLVAKAMKEVRQNMIQIKTILQSGAFSERNSIPPYQVVGFFLGDGGTHVVWGSKVITTTITWTGDRASAHALEFYSWSLFRDGVYRKAWKSKKRDVSRLILNGVDNFSKHVHPFFSSFPPPPCEKTEILNAILDTAIILKRLKTKTKWSDHDFDDLSKVIHRTWSLNISGPARKFGSPEIYIAHVKEQHKHGKLRIA